MALDEDGAGSHGALALRAPRARPAGALLSSGAVEVAELELACLEHGPGLIVGDPALVL